MRSLAKTGAIRNHLRLTRFRPVLSTPVSHFRVSFGFELAEQHRTRAVRSESGHGMAQHPLHGP